MITSIRCSKLDRPMKCRGFLSIKDLPEDVSGPEAQAGTAADEYLGHLIRKTQNIPTHASNGVEFDGDMKFYGEQTLKLIPEGALTQYKNRWQTRSGIWIEGSYDWSFTKDRNLYIGDYKYGWLPVEVKRNWQLIAYAIGEIIRLQTYFPKIVMRIHQPRPHHEDGVMREWTVTYEELMALKEEIEVRCEEIVAGRKELETGKQCKYCPAAKNGACPAFNRAVYHGIDYVLSDWKQDSLTDKEISFQLELLERTFEVLKQKLDSTRELAISRIRSGAIIANYMTESSYGDRVWKPGVGEKVLSIFLNDKKVTKSELLSPAQIEKMGVPKEFIAGLTNRFPKGLKLVRKDSSALADKIFNNNKKG